MCAMHDVTGALSLVMTDVKWQRIPVNLTNPVDIAAGRRRTSGLSRSSHLRIPLQLMSDVSNERPPHTINVALSNKRKIPHIFWFTGI
jgi:hypothetical protein